MFDQSSTPVTESELIAGLQSIDWVVVDELRHIATGTPGSPQERLRREFAAYRTIHRRLKASLPPSAALRQALFNLRRSDLGFVGRYDAGFFFEGSTSSADLHGDPTRMEIEAMARNGGTHSASTLDLTESESLTATHVFR